MTDTLVAGARGALMAKVRGKDTKPESVVRKVAHGLGYRYRLHRKDLPGSPDLVFAGKRKIIFVHGCFWHQHSQPECHRAGRPSSNVEFWNRKLNRNIERDRDTIRTLKAAGWDVMVVWECETKARDREKLTQRVSEFLSPAPIVDD